MIRTHAPTIVLVAWTLLLCTGVRPNGLAIPFLVSVAAAMFMMIKEIKMQIKKERRSGQDRRHHGDRAAHR